MPIYLCAMYSIQSDNGGWGTTARSNIRGMPTNVFAHSQLIVRLSCLRCRGTGDAAPRACRQYITRARRHSDSLRQIVSTDLPVADPLRTNRHETTAGQQRQPGMFLEGTRSPSSHSTPLLAGSHNNDALRLRLLTCQNPSLRSPMYNGAKQFYLPITVSENSTAS